MNLYDRTAPKRAINLSINADLVARARDQGLNLSALAESAVAAALANIARAKFETDIAQACRSHEHYLSEYGSLGDAVRDIANAAE